MKRKFVTLGITYLAAQLLAIICGHIVATVLASLTALFLIVCIVFRDKIPPISILILASALLAFSIFSVYSFAYVEPAHSLQGRAAIISGTVTEVPTGRDGRYYYVIETDKIMLSNVPQKVKFRLSSKSPLEAQLSDKIETQVVFNYPDDDASFTVKTNLLTDGILLTAYLPYGEVPVTTENESFSLKVMFAALREKISELIFNCFPSDVAALICALLMGDKTNLSNETLGWFRICGLSHLMAVSGLHLSIIMFLVNSFLMRFKRLDARIRWIIEIICVLGWMMFIGFSPSITRAGLMLIFSYLARILRRDTDSLNSLCAALFFLCLINPYAAADAGMLLSFFATLGLITLHKPIFKYLLLLLPPTSGRLTLTLLETLVSSFVATLFTLPISVLYFGEVSLISPLSNVLCIIPAMLLLILGTLLSLISAIPFIGYYIALIPCWLLTVIGRLMLLLVEFIASLPNAGVHLNYHFLPLFFAAVGAILITWYFNFYFDKERFHALIFSIALIVQILILSLACHFAILGNEQCVRMYSVENGMYMAVCSRGRCVVVGAGGDEYLAWQASLELEESGYGDIDALFLPNIDKAGASYAEEFITELKPDAIFAAQEGDMLYDIEYATEQIDGELYKIQSSLWRTTAADIMVRTESDANGDSWTCITTGELTVLVCPEGGDCALIPEYMRQPDCAVMLSEEIVNITYLDAIAIVVTADTDNSAHAESVLRFRGAKNVYSTGVSGDLRLSASGDAIEIGEMQ